MALTSTTLAVSFGDCDPAGIVFYPNFFGWMDRCFHHLLRERAGGHTRLCRELGAVGLGLMKVDASFRSPAAEGDQLTMTISEIIWDAKAFTLVYTAYSGSRLVMEGRETRGMFTLVDDRIRAGDVAPLRARLE